MKTRVGRLLLVPLLCVCACVLWPRGALAQAHKYFTPNGQRRGLTVIGKQHKAGSMMIHEFLKRARDAGIIDYAMVGGIKDGIYETQCAADYHAGRVSKCRRGSWLDVACNFTLMRELRPLPSPKMSGPSALEHADAPSVNGELSLVVLVNNGLPHNFYGNERHARRTMDELPPECRAMIAAGAYRYVTHMRGPFDAAVSDYLYTKANKEPHWMALPRPNLGGRSITQYLNEVPVEEGLVKNLDIGAMGYALRLYINNFLSSGASEIGAPQLPLRIERFKTYPEAFDAFREVLQFVTFDTATEAKIREVAAAAAEGQISASGGFQHAKHSTQGQLNDTSRWDMFKVLHAHPKQGPALCRARAELEYVPRSQGGYPCLDV